MGKERDAFIVHIPSTAKSNNCVASAIKTYATSTAVQSLGATHAKVKNRAKMKLNQIERTKF